LELLLYLTFILKRKKPNKLAVNCLIYLMIEKAVAIETQKQRQKFCCFDILDWKTGEKLCSKLNKFKPKYALYFIEAMG